MVTELKPIPDLFDFGAGVAKIVTDANLIIEYRHGQRLELPPMSWLLPPRERARIIETAPPAADPPRTGGGANPGRDLLVASEEIAPTRAVPNRSS